MKTVSYDFNQIEKCLKGSFEVEGIYMSNASKANLEKVKNREISYKDLVNSICDRYKEENRRV